MARKKKEPVTPAAQSEAPQTLVPQAAIEAFGTPAVVAVSYGNGESHQVAPSAVQRGGGFTLNGCPECGHIWDDPEDTGVCPQAWRHLPDEDEPTPPPAAPEMLAPDWNGSTPVGVVESMPLAASAEPVGNTPGIPEAIDTSGPTHDELMAAFDEASKAVPVHTEPVFIMSEANAERFNALMGAALAVPERFEPPALQAPSASDVFTSAMKALRETEYDYVALAPTIWTCPDCNATATKESRCVGCGRSVLVAFVPLDTGPAQTITPTTINYPAHAEHLWQLLDDIDTLDDACRSDDAAFRRAVRAVIGKRWGWTPTAAHPMQDEAVREAVAAPLWEGLTVIETPRPVKWTRTDTASHTTGASVTLVRPDVWAVHIDGRDCGTVEKREKGEALVEKRRG
jgi:rubrerythrin